MSSESSKPDLSKREATAELRKIEKQIEKILRRKEAGAWAIGRLVDAIATSGLHLEAGYASLDAYLDARFPQGYSTLRTYRRVALAFDEQSVKRHGVSKLDVGLSYLDAVGQTKDPRSLLTLMIRVPTDRNREDLVPFARTTLTNLQRAVAAARARPEKEDGATLKAAKRMQSLLQLAVAAPTGTHRHAPTVRVKPNPNGKGDLRIDVLSIDGDDLGRIGEALKDAVVSTDDQVVVKPPKSPRRRSGAASH